LGLVASGNCDCLSILDSQAPSSVSHRAIKCDLLKYWDESLNCFQPLVNGRIFDVASGLCVLQAGKARSAAEVWRSTVSLTVGKNLTALAFLYRLQSITRVLQFYKSVKLVPCFYITSSCCGFCQHKTLPIWLFTKRDGTRRDHETCFAALA
jgi:hypothetical protein